MPVTAEDIPRARGPGKITDDRRSQYFPGNQNTETAAIREAMRSIRDHPDVSKHRFPITIQWS